MDKYGIIGNPLGHSFSKGFFTEKFAKEGIDAQYLNFQIPDIHKLPEILKENPDDAVYKSLKEHFDKYQ